MSLSTAMCFAGAWALVDLNVHGTLLRVAYAGVLLAAFSAAVCVFHTSDRGLRGALRLAAWNTFWAGLIIAPALIVAVLAVVGGRE
jgi:NADH:ubiquinone oxidoreductase subunit 6 (subunit J)